MWSQLDLGNPNKIDLVPQMISLTRDRSDLKIKKKKRYSEGHPTETQAGLTFPPMIQPHS